MGFIELKTDTTARAHIAMLLLMSLLDDEPYFDMLKQYFRNMWE